MLSSIIRKVTRLSSLHLTKIPKAYITTPKTLAEKKKMAYQTQIVQPKSKQTSITSQPQDKDTRQLEFEQMLFQLGREFMQYLSLKTGSNLESVNIIPLISRHFSKMLKQFKHFRILELINLIEVIKYSCLNKLEHIQNIARTYQYLQGAIKQRDYNRTIEEHFGRIWKEDNLQTQIRSVCLLQFVRKQIRDQYLQKVIPLVKYFKTSQIMVMLYEKWKYHYSFSYELIDAIVQNQFYIMMYDINQSYIKMLFMQSIQGQFMPNQDGIFNLILRIFHQKPNVLAHTSFDKFVKILHAQGRFVQTEHTRHTLQASLNTFINIAKNQQYNENSMSLQQVVEIYLGFQQTNSTGQLLLSQITFLAKVTSFKMTSQNFGLFKKLLNSVIQNFEKKLKYERKDSLNKEYTFDTINFLKSFLPQYINLWPEVIFEVNHTHTELFPFQEQHSTLLKQFQTVFANILESRSIEIGLQNIEFTLKIMRFINSLSERPNFRLEEQVYSNILKQIIAYSNSNSFKNNHLELIYYILGQLSQRCRHSTFKEVVKTINSIIQRQMKQQLGKEKENSLIKSLDHRIVWLSLCNARIKIHEFPIDESIVEVFVNKQLYYMINTLQYDEVYQILVYTLSLHRLKPQVFERLLINLSTYIIYLHEKVNRQQSSYYFNHRYIKRFVPICKLIIQNAYLFKRVHDKQAFTVLQAMIVKNSEHFNKNDYLIFLDILEDPAFLIPSMIKILEGISFSQDQLQNFEYSSNLKAFQYYNKSLLNYFEGKFDEREVIKRLKKSNLNSFQIEDLFSKMQIYKTILMNGQISIYFDIPEPQTNVLHYKYMYICERIYQKIEKVNSFEFYYNRNFKKKRSKEVDLQDERQYMKQELLVQDNYNTFRIENRQLPKYLKMEVWKSYAFYQKSLSIEPRDIFFNSKEISDQILNKIIKGLFGKYQKIRQVLKQFTCNQDILTSLKESNIQFEHHGAAIEFKKTDQETTHTFLSCTNTNYKILCICAYFIQLHGNEVYILPETINTSSFLTFVKENFPNVEEEDKAGKEEEEEENQ